MTDLRQSGSYFVSWSGGKDSCLAMHRFRDERGMPRRLLTMLDETGQRSQGHYLRPEVLAAQAEALGVGLELRAATWEQYEDRFKDALRHLKASGIQEGVFGDIDLDPHREWVERVAAECGMTAHEPLWLEGRESLIEEFLDAGYVAVIVGVKDGVLASDMLGRVLDRALVAEFTAAGIDACGELGEYHTVVVDGPAFRHPVELVAGEQIALDRYRFLDLVPQD
jgi:uncharacterized protein (TIGR00290 family)